MKLIDQKRPTWRISLSTLAQNSLDFVAVIHIYTYFDCILDSDSGNNLTDCLKKNPQNFVSFFIDLKRQNIYLKYAQTCIDRQTDKYLEQNIYTQPFFISKLCFKKKIFFDHQKKIKLTILIRQI